MLGEMQQSLAPYLVIFYHNTFSQSYFNFVLIDISTIYISIPFPSSSNHLSTHYCSQVNMFRYHKWARSNRICVSESNFIKHVILRLHSCYCKGQGLIIWGDEWYSIYCIDHIFLIYCLLLTPRLTQNS